MEGDDCADRTGMKGYKKQVNEKVFDEWNPEMAYLLGFIAADGCVYKGYLQIGLSIQDKAYLEQIKSLLGASHAIWERTTNKGHKACHLQIGSKRLVQSLLMRGISPRKSLTMVWHHVPKEWLPHFVRGYCDGDGCLRTCNSKLSKYKHLSCAIAGTRAFLEGLQAAYAKSTGHKAGSIRRSNGCYLLTFIGTKSPLQFCSWMYADSSESTRLRRKWKIYSDYYNMFGHRMHESQNNNPACGEAHGKSKVGWPEVVEMRQRFASGESKASLARSFGLSFMGVHSILIGRTWKQVA